MAKEELAQSKESDMTGIGNAGSVELLAKTVSSAQGALYAADEVGGFPVRCVIHKDGRQYCAARCGDAALYSLVADLRPCLAVVSKV